MSECQEILDECIQKLTKKRKNEVNGTDFKDWDTPRISTSLSDDINVEIERNESIKGNNKGISLNICVLGTGSYATAIACICARVGHNVIMLGRHKNDCDYINKKHRNSKYLKEFDMEKNIKATHDINVAITSNTKIIIHCIPTQYTPDYLKNIKQYIRKDIIFISTSKGIHLKSQKLLSSIIPNILARNEHNNNICYLSGPSFAKEMMQRHPIAVTVACNNFDIAKYVQNILNSVYFRIYITNDVIGTEVGGALKNPLAIGAGIASGLGYGQSTIAGIVTRGAVEIQRMSMALGGKPATMAGLCGFGDLMLTCFCELSRNRTCGYYIGKYGLNADKAQKKVGSTVEGLATAKVIMILMKKYQLRMPLFYALGMIIDGKMEPKQAMKQIMSTQPSNQGFVLN